MGSTTCSSCSSCSCAHLTVTQLEPCCSMLRSQKAELGSEECQVSQWGRRRRRSNSNKAYRSTDAEIPTLMGWGTFVLSSEKTHGGPLRSAKIGQESPVLPSDCLTARGRQSLADDECNGPEPVRRRGMLWTHTTHLQTRHHWIAKPRSH